RKQSSTAKRCQHACSACVVRALISWRCCAISARSCARNCRCCGCSEACAATVSTHKAAIRVKGVSKAENFIAQGSSQASVYHSTLERQKLLGLHFIQA